MTTLPDRSPTVGTLSINEFRVRYPFQRRGKLFAHPLIPGDQFLDDSHFNCEVAYIRAKNVPLDVADQTVAIFHDHQAAYVIHQVPLLRRYLLPAPEPIEPQPWFGKEYGS